MLNRPLLNRFFRDVPIGSAKLHHYPSVCRGCICRCSIIIAVIRIVVVIGITIDIKNYSRRMVDQNVR
jgi:hypothetical protein